MEWTDKAILLSAAKYGENASLVRAFSRDQGIVAGMVRGGSKIRTILQPGNVVQAHWKARLEEHLGMFTLELTHPFAASVMHDRTKLQALTAACATILTLLPERDPHPVLFDAAQDFLSCLARAIDSADWRVGYIHMELLMLRELGFGLDLERCADTGTTNNLVYVSPKTGRAVCAESGAPYHDRMLPLPLFLRPELPKENAPKPRDILDGLVMTRYFLEHFVCQSLGKVLPYARLDMESAFTPTLEISG